MDSHTHQHLYNCSRLQENNLQLHTSQCIQTKRTCIYSRLQVNDLQLHAAHYIMIKGGHVAYACESLVSGPPLAATCRSEALYMQ